MTVPTQPPTEKKPRILIGPEHGPAHAAGLRLCRNLRNALEPFRGKDRGADLFFAGLDDDQSETPAA
jgi:hypothetical protein